MKKKYKFFLGAAAVWLLGVIAWYLHKANFAVLSPHGPVAAKERQLMFLTGGLALIVVIPVYVMLFLFAWRYRESNNATYRPEFKSSAFLELLWWGIPGAIILALSIITWQSSHSLDPHQALISTVKPLNIEVVALDWKWLFIYPQQGIASVNFLQFPVNTPLNLTITADAPMNSFWIPQLGGQIYAMPGMSSPLHLLANQTGDYQGSSANLSGAGFASMTFIARASTDSSFANWVSFVRTQPQKLDENAYNVLAKPSQNNANFYSAVDPNIYSQVILKYMTPEKI